MKDYPFIKCLHPLKIKNPYTCEMIQVPCGKCAACLRQKGAINTLKCKLESLSHKYCMFVTLTYSNDYIPTCKAYYQPEEIGGNIPVIKDKKKSHTVFVNTCDRIGTDDLIVAETDTTIEDLALLESKCNMNGYFPYLYKPDVQNFMKRLRSNIDYSLKRLYKYDTISKTKQTPEKIRYFAAGEYGPVHFRPHFHLLLWFDKPETLALIGQNIHKSWTFGRVDYSLSRGQASSYTAGYINSACKLPKVFKTSQTKPFCCHSIRLGEKIFKNSKEEVYKMEPLTFTKRSIPIDGTNTDVNLWRSFTFIYYPKCTDYASKSTSQRLYSYKIYATASCWTRETKPYQIAKKITDYVFTNGFELPYPLTPFDNEVNNMLNYLFYRTKKTAPLSLMDEEIDGLKDYYFRVIYNELRISHHFLTFCCSDSRTPSIMLDMIEKFYSALDYDMLRQQYELQEKWFNDSDAYKYMYNNSPVDMKQFKDIPLYKMFHTQTIDDYNNSIKHKKLNDLNNIFVNK